MCTVSYNVQEQHFAVHIVCYHMLMNILVVGTQNSTKCENSKLAGKPIFSSNIVLYFIMYVILNEFIRTHTHTEIFKPLLLKFPKT